MKGVLPDAILNRPKMGFPVPFANWTRGAWNAVAREVLLDRRTRERGLIDSDAVDRLLTRHASGQTDGGDRIWSLLNLELWYRTFIDRGGIQSLPLPVSQQSPHGRARAQTFATSPSGAAANAHSVAQI